MAGISETLYVESIKKNAIDQQNGRQNFKMAAKKWNDGYFWC